MSGNCLNAGLVRAQFLEERVICLQIQHTSTFPVGLRCRRRFHVKRIHDVVLNVQIHVVLMRIVQMRILIVRMVFVVWRIVAGKNQIGIVIIAIINDNIWFLGWPIFGDYFHVGFMIRPRIRIRLLIGGCEVIIHPIQASIIAIVHIRYDIFTVSFCDDVAKVEIAVWIEAVHQNVPIVIIVVVGC